MLLEGLPGAEGELAQWREAQSSTAGRSLEVPRSWLGCFTAVRAGCSLAGFNLQFIPSIQSGWKRARM